MNKQQAYEELCDKANKYDKMCEAYDKAKKEVKDRAVKEDVVNFAKGMFYAVDIIDKHLQDVTNCE